MGVFRNFDKDSKEVTLFHEEGNDDDYTLLDLLLLDTEPDENIIKDSKKE